MDKEGSFPSNPTLQVALARGLVGQCPHCGQGKLYHAYLKQVDHCASCGEGFGDIETDDAAPWFTILLSGILAAPLFFVFQGLLVDHVVMGTLVISLIVIVLILVLLPRVKGVLISAFWFGRRANRNG